MSIGMPGGKVCEGVCITARVVAGGKALEWRKEKGV
jgi:hypothetical protein